MNQSERRLYLINALLDENLHYKDAPVPARADEQKALLRALMNIRRPREISGEFLKVQDAYLKEETLRKGITDADDLEFAPPGICIWQGDITTLKCDAIVNAANSGLTGCYVPNHRCISTGEFHFPNEAAAEIALESVSSFLKKQTAVKKVIFNVFKDTDKEIYERLLSTDIEA